MLMREDRRASPVRLLLISNKVIKTGNLDMVGQSWEPFQSTKIQKANELKNAY